MLREGGKVHLCSHSLSPKPISKLNLVKKLRHIKSTKITHSQVTGANKNVNRIQKTKRSWELNLSKELL